MSRATEALTAQIAKLPLEERILDSLDQPDTALDALWAKEAGERLAAYRRGEIKAVDLSDVIAEYQVNTKLAERPFAGASAGRVG